MISIGDAINRLLRREPPGEVERTKELARSAYDRYMRHYKHYDCGHSMAQHVSPALADAAHQYDAHMRRLAELDPQCPPVLPLAREWCGG